MPILQTHAYTHAHASTSLHTKMTSKQANRTRSRRRTQTPRSATTRLACRKQDAWCEHGKYKAKQTQFLAQRRLKKQLKARKIVPKIIQKHPWRPPESKKTLEHCPRPTKTQFMRLGPPSCTPKASQIHIQKRPRRPKIKNL